MDTNITTDIVELDDATALDISDNEGSTSVALIGTAALAAGVAIGTFVVPPVVGFVKSWFASSKPAKAEEIAEPTTAPETKKETKSA